MPAPHQTTDRWLIFASAGFRATAVGLTGVILAIYLATLGLTASVIGLAVSLGLAGTVIGTFVVIHAADRFGRRATLAMLALLMGLGGLMLAVAPHLPVLMAGLLIGMVNGMGRDRGPGMTVEQAILPRLTTPAGRTSAFAWYNLVVDVGHALGSLLGGLPAFLRAYAHCAPSASYRWVWALYSALCLLAGLVVLWVSKSVELATAPKREPLSSVSRPIVTKFAALQGLDSLGGGFLTSALVGYWFFQRFGVSEALLGPLFFTARVLNGLSHLAAAWLSKRIGLIKTMVWTHLPSSILLMTVPIAPSLGVAATLFLLREVLVEMDVPTRQSYLVAVVRDEERTKAAGITNLTRGVAWAVAPSLAGPLMQTVSLSAPLLIGPTLKVAYDVLLYRAFRHLKPPEECSNV